MGKIIEFLRDEKAATSIEYAMIASCIAVAIVPDFLHCSPRTLPGKRLNPS